MEITYHSRLALDEGIRSYTEKGQHIDWGRSKTTGEPPWILVLGEVESQTVQGAQGVRKGQYIGQESVSEALKAVKSTPKEPAPARAGTPTTRIVIQMPGGGTRAKPKKKERPWRTDARKVGRVVAETGRLGQRRETAALRGIKGVGARFHISKPGISQTGGPARIAQMGGGQARIARMNGGRARIAEAPGMAKIAEAPMPGQSPEEPRQGSGLGLSRRPRISYQTGGGGHAPSIDSSRLGRSSYIKTPEEMRNSQ